MIRTRAPSSTAPFVERNPCRNILQRMAARAEYWLRARPEKAPQRAAPATGASATTAMTAPAWAPALLRQRWKEISLQASAADPPATRVGCWPRPLAALQVTHSPPAAPG